MRRPALPVIDRLDAITVIADGRVDLTGGLASVVVLAVWAAAGGPIGAVAALVVALGWAIGGVGLAIAAGSVVAVSLAPAVVPADAALLTATLGAYLLVPVAHAPRPEVYLGGAVLGVVSIGAVVALTAVAGPTWLAGVVAVAACAVAVYVGHRIALVRLGQVGTT